MLTKDTKYLQLVPSTQPPRGIKQRDDGQPSTDAVARGSVETATHDRRPTLSLTREAIAFAAAATLVAAVAKANEVGVPMAIAVVDESGVLEAFGRMDGNSFAIVEIVQAKAHTVATFRVTISVLA